MGLLDDAIRQHLELKRQHGAPEEEIERQEEEALGPARRDVAPADTSDGDGEVELEASEAGEEAAAAEAAPEAHEEETVLQELDDEPGEPATVSPDAETVLREQPREAVADPEDPFDLEPDETELDADLEPERDPAPEPDTEAPPTAPADEDAPEEDKPEGTDADVLEDTPDFLQETPEHDRLWFEQKPPRDFDFD